MEILRVDLALLGKILPLIAQYQAFYGFTVPPERNRKFFTQLIENPEEGIQFGAFDSQGAAQGFCTLFFPLSSLSAQRYCLLNDLFTIETARGKGVGRSLIQKARDQALTRGFEGLEWMTKQSNLQAQLLYNKLGAGKSEWLYYHLPTNCGKT